MIEVNLIPDVKLEFIKARRTRAKVVMLSVIICVASIGLVVVLCIYTFGVQTVRGVLADNSIKTEYAKLEKVEDISKVMTIQNQLSKISTLNDDKKMNSRLFDMLSAIIPPSPNQIQVSHLGVDAITKTVTIEGQAQNSYAALEVFRKTIQNAKVKFVDVDKNQQEVELASDINTSNTSYGEDASGNKVLRFTISFTYAEELFAPASDNVAVVIGASGNVTDSYLGVPTAIFAVRADDIDEGSNL